MGEILPYVKALGPRSWADSIKIRKEREKKGLKFLRPHYT